MAKQAVLVLNLGLGPVFHPAAWRHDDTDLSAVYDFAEYRRITQKAEAAKLHAVFSADTLAVSPNQVSTSPVRYWEPLTFFSALAVSTTRIGLLVSASSTFTEPFNLARQFNSLDKLSNGRVGWNIVTSALDRSAQNYGLDQLPEHDKRYEVAAEFVDVVTRLWDSWDADALYPDRENGHLFRQGAVREVDFVGKFHRVRGPLNMPRSPQGWPVLSQAGDSEAGRAFAAQIAELIYTRHTRVADAQAFYRDIKARAAAFGRDPDDVKILSGQDIIIADSSAEADDKRNQLARLRSPIEVLGNLARTTGIDLTACAPSDPLPPMPKQDETRQGHGALGIILQVIADTGVKTVGELTQQLVLRQARSILAGSATDIADIIEQWLAAEAADGFVLDPVFFPNTADRILNELVPELVRRGLFRTDYAGTQLRTDLGLKAR